MDKNRLKSNRGAITLFVILTCMFFLVAISGVAVSLKNKEEVIDEGYKELKESYNNVEITSNGYDDSGVKYADINFNYEGYYADVDNDGTIDGIIYADLAFEKSLTGWGNNSSGRYARYSYDGTGKIFRKYSVRQCIGTEDVFQNEGEVISMVDNFTKSYRFYVMALEDYSSEKSYWYRDAYGKLDSSMGRYYKGNDFGEGKEKTKILVEKWNGEEYGAKDDSDLWKIFYNDNNTSGKIDPDKWFLPSISEWCAFKRNLGITKDNYIKYGLNSYYWSSTIYAGNKYSAFVITPSQTYDENSNSSANVRLSTTF